MISLEEVLLLVLLIPIVVRGVYVRTTRKTVGVRQ